MLRIAICDDQPDDLLSHVSLMNQYLSLNHIEAEVKAFSHPDVLLKAIKVENFHIYILDIIMPMVNGLELGKVLRRHDRESQIIFITSEPQFALQAYASFPINYLIKPVETKQLYETLNLAISKVNLRVEQTFTVKTADSIRVIKLSEIVFCEYFNHAVNFFLTNGDRFVSRTIRESFSDYMEAILKDMHFIQSHASFIVNMRWVERFTKTTFTLRGDQTVPISAKQYATVRDAYMDYLMTKGAVS